MSSEREQQMEKLRTGGNRLNLGKETVQAAEILYQKVTDESDLVGLGIDSVLATTLLIASKQNRLPVTVSDIYEGWHDVFDENEVQDSFSKKKIGRIERKFTEEFGLEIPPNQPDVLINRYAEELNMPKAMSTTAQDILSDVLDAAPSVVTGGRAPSAIAATSLYLAAVVHKERLKYTQEQIGEVADTSEVTIRNRYPEFEEALGGEKQLKKSYQPNSDKQETITESQGDSEMKEKKKQDKVPTEDQDSKIVTEVTQLHAQTFVFTGNIKGWTRDEIREAVEAVGGRTTESVSSKTDYLVVGKSPGDRKTQDAEKHEVPRIEAEQFLEKFEDDLPTRYEIDTVLYAIVKNAVDTEEFDSTEDLVNSAVRSMLKRDIDGESLNPDVSEREKNQAIFVKLDDRLDRFLDLLINDDNRPFESESAFVETALRAELDVESGESTAKSVEIPPDIVAAIEGRIDQSAEHNSVDDFVKNAVLNQI